MENTVDLLKIKIDKARTSLSEESRQAIDAIDWKKIILDMRAEKGYSYEQLEDLEIETELLLCGLLDTEDYPKELEKRMLLPKAQIDVLVNEMNEKVFNRIREELVKIIERKKGSEPKEEKPPVSPLSGGEIMRTSPDKERQQEGFNSPRVPFDTASILEQKLRGAVQSPTIETNHSIGNLSKENNSSIKKIGVPKVDPYRETPE